MLPLNYQKPGLQRSDTLLELPVKQLLWLMRNNVGELKLLPEEITGKSFGIRKGQSDIFSLKRVWFF
jgi:hypothetical protein